jgi:hypothetical protein
LIAWACVQPDWAIGFLDEVWWSRFALPRMHAWQSEDRPARLIEQAWKKGDPDPKALACHGVLWQEGIPDDPVREQMWLRFVTGRPVSDISIQFLDCCCERLAKQGKRAWLLIWDNARLSCEQDRAHLDTPTQFPGASSGQGCPHSAVLLPTKSPWLNPIEPKWVPGSRAIVEPDGLLSAQQLAQRVCSHFACSYEAHLSIPEKVA